LIWFAPSNYELWVFFTLTLGDSYFPFLAYSCFPITGVLAYSCFEQRHLNLKGNINTRANRKAAMFLIKKITYL